MKYRRKKKLVRRNRASRRPSRHKRSSARRSVPSFEAFVLRHKGLRKRYGIKNASKRIAAMYRRLVK